MTVAALLPLALSAASATSADDTRITIATGDVGGVYYPAAGAICSAVNRNATAPDPSCTALSTAGSEENLSLLRAGDVEFAIVQSDWLNRAYQGLGRYRSKPPFDSLRSVIALHTEAFTVLARADAGINEFSDLRGKRVNIGNPGSGQRATMELLMQTYGWVPEDFADVSELSASQQSAALCANEVDAIIYVVGHPAGAIQDATANCDTRFVPVGGDRINALVAASAVYSDATIPGGLYAGNAQQTSTFGVRAMLVTTADMPKGLVDSVVTPVMGNLDALKSVHPALAALAVDDMVPRGRVVPVHPAARTYYAAIGLTSSPLEKDDD